MSTPRAADVLTADVGTVYRVPTYDTDVNPPVNFDPSTASVKEIVFRMPTGDPDTPYRLLTRTATAEQIELDDVDVWCLVYTVVPADIAAYDEDDETGGFHVAAGELSLEGHLEFSSSQQWTSSPVTTDQQGRRLRVLARLEA